MARSLSTSRWSDSDAPSGKGDLKELRSQLMSLLDQVEDRYQEEERFEEPAPRRGQAVRDTQSARERHEAALRSVQDAVDRFDDRAGYSEHALPPNPQDMLQAAISQIRNRSQGGRYPQAEPYDSRPRETRADARKPRHRNDDDELRRFDRNERPHRREDARARPAEQDFAAPRDAHDDWRSRHEPAPYTDNLADRLAESMGGLVRRMEGVEAHLQAQNDSAEDIHEVVNQVEQLTGVVEMLAGAVGEAGQVKRLEGQLASLAQAVADGQGPDLSALVRRIDELVANVDRIADMQALSGQENRRAGGKDSQTESMRAIEASVRNIYDRIDSMERSLSVAPEDIERLTREMARFTEEMNAASKSGVNGGLLHRVDALHTRLAQIEEGGAAVGGLKGDIEALRATVAEAIEPRFAALEAMIEASIEHQHGGGDGGGGGGDSASPQIEERLRQLAERMDETGEQLSGLARLYSNSAQQPDYDAIAERVARRTTEEIAKIKSNGENRLTERSLEDLEERLSGLFAGAPKPDLSGVSSGIKQVEERLKRLELSLSESQSRAARPAEPVAQPDSTQTFAKLDAAMATGTRPAAKLARTVEPPASGFSKSSAGDIMPSDPNEDRPLNAPSYPDPTLGVGAAAAPESAAARTSKVRLPGDTPVIPNTARPEAIVAGEEMPLTDLPAGLASEAGIAPSPSEELPHGKQYVVPPEIDPELIERPARPVSSFDKVSENAFEAPERAKRDTIVRSAPPEDGEPRPTTDRDTFIEAARRAAQRGQQADTAAASSRSSLVGRALARFGSPRTAGHDPLPGMDPERSMDALAFDDTQTGQEGEQGSFLLRHRRPILLGATLVAVVFLTLNLVAQRMSAPAEPPASVEAPAPVEPSVGQDPVFDVDTDTGPTGSIPPRQVLSGWTRSGDTAPVMPGELETGAIGSLVNQGPENAGFLVDEGPVQLELPPAEIGPLGLREAAAGGDPRAQFEVAAIYTEGRAVPQDMVEAAKWYERSAAQGFAPAGYRLGNLYETGSGVEQDLFQARLWYQRAAEAGNRMSMHNLAALNSGSELGEPQFDTAAEWFEQAAARGLTDSQFNLGMLYARGLGVQQDLPLSYVWFSLAALRGDEDAAKARDDIAQSLDSETISNLNMQVNIWRPAQIDIASNFAPIGAWAEEFDPGEPITDTNVVQQVQAALGRLGFDVGTPDGVLGPKTREAISAFETATGMSTSGAVNPRLLAVLGSQPV